MKKFLGIAILFALAFAFVGCNNEPTQPDNITGELYNIPPETDETAPLTGRIHEPRDFGGRTLRVGAWFAEPIVEFGWGDEPDRATATNYPIDRMIWDNARRVEQLFNVNFEYVVVGYDDFQPNLVSSVAAGHPFADIVLFSGWMQMESMGSVIQPWDSANLPNSDILGAQIFGGPTTEIGDNIWAVDIHGPDTHAFGLGVNLDIINADGLPNPVDLFERGEWTWEAMLDIMRRGTRDTTGDTIIDQFGIGGQPGEIVQHLIGANDGVLVDDDLNYGFDHPNTIRALEFAQQIFGERLWYVSGDGFYSGNWNRNFYAPYQSGNAVLFPMVTWAIDNQPPAFNYALVPFPAGPDNTSGNTWLRGIEQAICVPVGTSWDVADILIILEEIFAWPGDEPELLFEAGGIDWMRDTFPTEADVQRAIYAGMTAAHDIGRSVPRYYWVLGDFATAFWDQEMDVLQAIEYHRGPRQEMLDTRFR
ncbi:MAG: extracellular solute-binding protein [Defluviitaleaceae bacterium]|nr:extracellular solute-binding protein [Defluviitaleaceae bacterium]